MLKAEYGLENKNLYEGLVQLNKQWAEITPENKWLTSPSPTHWDDLIHAHLGMVEAHLRANPPKGLSPQQFANRLQCLDILQEYNQQKQYPLNIGHLQPTPYFIDHQNTACAVGHLMREHGAHDLAMYIAANFNNHYIEDMPQDELLEWAEKNGFSLFELKLIQPGYGAQFVVFADLEQPDCGINNGSINIGVIEYECLYEALNDDIRWEQFLGNLNSSEIEYPTEFDDLEGWDRLEYIKDNYGGTNNSEWLPVLMGSFSFYYPCMDESNYELGNDACEKVSLDLRNHKGELTEGIDLEAGVYYANINYNYMYWDTITNIGYECDAYWMSWCQNKEVFVLNNKETSNEIDYHVENVSIIMAGYHQEYYGEGDVWQVQADCGDGMLYILNDYGNEHNIWDFEGNYLGNYDVTQNLNYSSHFNHSLCYYEFEKRQSLVVEITNPDGCKSFERINIDFEDYSNLLSITSTPATCGQSNGKIKLYCTYMLYSDYGLQYPDYDFVYEDVDIYIDGYLFDYVNETLPAGTYTLEVDYVSNPCILSGEIEVPEVCVEQENCDFSIRGAVERNRCSSGTSFNNVWGVRNNQTLYIDTSLSLIDFAHKNTYDIYYDTTYYVGVENDSLIVDFEVLDLLPISSSTSCVNSGIDSLFLVQFNCIEYLNTFNEPVDSFECDEFLIGHQIEYHPNGVNGSLIIVGLPYFDCIVSYNGVELEPTATFTTVVTEETFYLYESIDFSTNQAVFEIVASVPNSNCIEVINLDLQDPLPLELLNFNIETTNNQNSLFWQTASAVDEDYFILQHSTDGVNFTDLARIETINHSGGIEYYSYLHNSQNCSNYYRLQSVGLNGIKRVVSDIISAENCNNNKPLIYPTITNGLVYCTNCQGQQIQLFNALGKKLKLTNNSSNTIDLSNYPSGQYFVVIGESATKIFKT